MQLDDLAKGIGANVHVGLRFNLARGAYHRSQVLLLRLARLYGDEILAALVHRHTDDDHKNQRNADSDQYFFPSLHEPSCGQVFQ